MDQTARAEGPIRQAVDAVDKRLQHLNEKIILLEEVLTPAMCPAPPSGEKGVRVENPGSSELSTRLWEVEERLASQGQRLALLMDLLEI